MSTLSKVCRKCGEQKPVSEFWECHRRKDGFQSYCKDCSKTKLKKWVNDNIDHVRASARSRHQPYTDRQREWHHQNYQLQKDRILARNKAWAKSNPKRIRELSLAGTNRRKVRQLGAEGAHTHEEWTVLQEWCGHRCVCCDERKPLSKDHIVPLIAGGSDYISNIQPLCRECNSSKRTQTINYLSGLAVPA